MVLLLLLLCSRCEATSRSLMAWLLILLIINTVHKDCTVVAAAADAICDDAFCSLGLEATLEIEVVLGAGADKVLEEVEDTGRILDCDSFANDIHLLLMIYTSSTVSATTTLASTTASILRHEVRTV